MVTTSGVEEGTTQVKKGRAKSKAKQETDKVTEALMKFVFMDKTRSILDISMATDRNTILFGKGGYGKSDYTLAYMQAHGIEPYIITMGAGMTTDRLFGGIDLPTFNKTGKIEYLLENSFMNHEYVIFEELFDAPDFILEQLKDILSSKEFRNGGQRFPLKTKVIICCTNKTREDFAKNSNSLKALMERFPLELEVKWKDHNKITYETLLNATYGHANPLLTYVLEEFAKDGTTISPRIAIVAADIIDKCGPDCLEHIADFNVKPDLLKTAIAKFKSLSEILDKISKLQGMCEHYEGIKLTTIDELKEKTALNKEIFKELTNLKNVKADESMVEMSTEAIKNFTRVYNDNKTALAAVVNGDLKDVETL